LFLSTGRRDESTPALSEIEQKIGVVLFLLFCPAPQYTLKHAEVLMVSGSQ